MHHPRLFIGSREEGKWPDSFGSSLSKSGEYSWGGTLHEIVNYFVLPLLQVLSGDFILLANWNLFVETLVTG